jgi:hypothetical protein
MIGRLFGALLLGYALTACGGGGDSAPQTFEVKYGATGFGGGDVTYSTPGGGTAQEHVPNGVAFAKAYTAKAGDFLYVSVQNNSSDASAVSLATIDVNGKPFRAERSTGPFFIATANGTCCQ